MSSHVHLAVVAQNLQKCIWAEMARERNMCCHPSFAESVAQLRRPNIVGNLDHRRRSNCFRTTCPGIFITPRNLLPAPAVYAGRKIVKAARLTIARATSGWLGPKNDSRRVQRNYGCYLCAAHLSTVRPPSDRLTPFVSEMCRAAQRSSYHGFPLH